jgi:DNA-directed RNA polymerase specialized sigma24 family protein
LNDTDKDPDRHVPARPPPSAKEAAATGDARAMVEAMFVSGFVDGLVGRVDRAWRLLDRAAAEDAVADAVGALYGTVLDGKVVESPEGYVVKAAWHIAQVEHKRRKTLREPEDFEADDDEEDDDFGPSRSEWRDEAIRVARRLLPQMGQTNPRRVIEVIVDAVEAGIPDISNAEIGRILSLTNDVVRQSKKRGFERLERLAAEQGQTAPFAASLAPDTHTNDDEEDLDE